MPESINPISVFDTSFINLPHLELATHLIGIGDAFISHSLYQEVPEGVPHGTEIKDAGTRYHDLIYAVMSGAFAKKAERDAYRAKAVQTATLALNWAGMRYLREGNFCCSGNFPQSLPNAQLPGRSFNLATCTPSPETKATSFGQEPHH